MGWLISYDLTKKQQIAELVTGWTDKETGNGVQILDYSVRGNVLFTLNQRLGMGHHPYIGITLLRKDRDGGWGYKDLTEAENPGCFECPLKFLKRAPVANAAWRKGVEAFHANRRARARNTLPPIGEDTYLRLVPGTYPYLALGVVKVHSKSGRGFQVHTPVGLVKIQRKHIAEVFPVKVLSFERYGCFAWVEDGTLWTSAMEADGSFDPAGFVNGTEVTAPEDQEFLDSMNLFFGTHFKFEQFAGR